MKYLSEKIHQTPEGSITCFLPLPFFFLKFIEQFPPQLLPGNTHSWLVKILGCREGCKHWIAKKIISNWFSKYWIDRNTYKQLNLFFLNTEYTRAATSDSITTYLTILFSKRTLDLFSAPTSQDRSSKSLETRKTTQELSSNSPWYVVMDVHSSLIARIFISGARRISACFTNSI